MRSWVETTIMWYLIRTWWFRSGCYNCDFWMAIASFVTGLRPSNIFSRSVERLESFGTEFPLNMPSFLSLIFLKRGHRYLDSRTERFRNHIVGGDFLFMEENISNADSSFLHLRDMAELKVELEVHISARIVLFKTLDTGTMADSSALLA